MTDRELPQMRYAKETVYAFFNAHEDTSVLETFKVSLHELIALYKQGVRHGINATHAPKREWVGFTHEELAWLNEALNLGGRLAAIEAIEAKLKEKNGG
jgi:hypothetical protein